MMAAIFATMLAALIFDWSGRKRCALVCLFACFVLSAGLFLYEIYSPDYGFRMPWLQTEFGAPAAINGKTS